MQPRRLIFFPSDLKTSEASTGAHFCKWPWGPCQGHPGVSFCNGVSFWQKCPDVGLVPENWKLPNLMVYEKGSVIWTHPGKRLTSRDWNLSNHQKMSPSKMGGQITVITGEFFKANAGIQPTKGSYPKNPKIKNSISWIASRTSNQQDGLFVNKKGRLG